MLSGASSQKAHQHNQGGGVKAERIEGAALRALLELLDDVDKEDYWDRPYN